MTDENHLKAIAFYLPQFHPIRENNEWWGPGFTEWTNVAKTSARFKGHYQPHLPADLGFCDLRVPEVRTAQTDIARQYGIHGFCYYHYWFAGKRILERPFNEVLSSGEPDFPFCLCWANENWTRAWDGGENQILLGQNHSEDDDKAHIENLIPAFRDKRYIRIDGKPLFLVYRSELLPDSKKTTEIWREAVRKAGLGEIYLARVEQFVSDIVPESVGFDAAVEFAPSGNWLGEPMFRDKLSSILIKLGLLSPAFRDNNVIPYDAVARTFNSKPEPEFKRFPCVTPMWDNSARRKHNARIIVDSTPEKYQNWLKQAIRKANKRFDDDERIVFINAWNEWAEGCHLEPDQKWGHAYLEATRQALSAGHEETTPAVVKSNKQEKPTTLQIMRWKLDAEIRALRKLAGQISMPGKYDTSGD